VNTSTIGVVAPTSGHRADADMSSRPSDGPVPRPAERVSASVEGADRPTRRRRCQWADSDPLLRAYHDSEWGVPERDSRRLWEKLMLDGFQAGLSWLIILRKREAFRNAFEGFDPALVARYGERDVTRLVSNPEIVRSRAKIEATIAGARAYLAFRATVEEFGPWVWRLAGGSPIQGRGPVPTKTPLSERLSVELKQRGFKFVGPVIVYAWMQATGIVNDHSPSCYRREPVRRLGQVPRS
jgi:DNA-3-methyladenine glycosylase I